MGPRNCVGMRFAMEEIKIALCTIVKEFRFFPVDETPVSFIFIQILLRLCVYHFHSKLCGIFLSKDTIQFEDGVLAVAQPVNFPLGIQRRGQ